MTKAEKIIKEKDPSYDPKAIGEAKMKSRRRTKKFNVSIWSIDEQRLYVDFLITNKVLFQTEKQRRKSNIFVCLSAFMVRRSADQCRSHHQKMEIKFGDVEQIIQGLQKTKLCQGQNTCMELRLDQNSKLDDQAIKQIKESINQYSNQIQQVSQSKYEISNSPFIEVDNIWGCIDSGMWIQQSQIAHQ